MKTKIFLVMLLAVALFSCQKEKVDTAATQDVSFTATLIDPGAGLKNTEAWECLNLEPDYAKVVIDGISYFPKVFRLGTVLYTQAIKLAVPPSGTKTYVVSLFVLYDDGGTPGAAPALPEADDQIVMATPNVFPAPYSVYVTKPVPFDITVTKFAKAEINVEVLCFQQAYYTYFGFDWFVITEIVIREACFFGDICLENLSLWNEYPYTLGGVKVDEEAYINIIVKANGILVPGHPFNNSLIYGTGLPLCVQYPDVLNVVDNFTFELQVWVPISTGPTVFGWVTYATFATTDANPIPQAQADGVVDFAIGTCSPESYPIFTWLGPH